MSAVLNTALIQQVTVSPRPSRATALEADALGKQMAEDDPEEYPEPVEIIGTPTVERMAEIFREVAQELDAMSPEERAEHLTKETLRQQRADEELFAGRSLEERLEIQAARESFHDSMRGERPIRISSPSSSKSPFPWLDPTPEDQLGAEAALEAKRNANRRRCKPRSDG